VEKDILGSKFHTVLKLFTVSNIIAVFLQRSYRSMSTA